MTWITEDWKDELEAEYPEKTEYERMELMYEINGDYLDDERCNLNIPLSQPILVIADLGRWNGRFSGYKEIKKRPTSATVCIPTQIIPPGM